MATGKSTVALAFEEAGFKVIDSDRLVADLYLPGGDGTTAVRELFGDSMLTAEGGVDHSKLAREVFSISQSRMQLERAVHPLVRRDFEALLEDETGVVVLEATLLIEAGMAAEFDLVVLKERICCSGTTGI
jgi:dephospho-CoA kinase